MGFQQTGQKKPSQRLRASSLVFVMLIVAGIVTVVFGGQRLALVQFSQSTREEDNLSASYAAKAGVEDGLARFRFERDSETIQKNGFTAERYDLTNGENKGYIKDDTPITATTKYDPNHQYYDLKIDFKKDKIDNLAIAKDSTLQLNGFTDSASAYYLYFRFAFPANSTNCFVQLQQISTSALNSTAYQQVVATQIGTSLVYDSAANGQNLPIRTSINGGTLSNQVRVRPFNCDVTANFKTVTGTNNTTAANINFDSTTTSITATGYFGSTKRTLLATVNRQSGQLISIFDFNAFAGNGNIKPKP